MRAFVRILIKFLIVSCVIVGALEGGLYFVQFNNYKTAIQQEALKKFGLKIKIGGDIKYSIIPLPHVVLQDVNISTDNGLMLARAHELDLYSKKLSLPSSLSDLHLNKIGISNGILNFNHIYKITPKNLFVGKDKIPTIVINNSTIEITKNEGTLSKAIQILKKVNLKFTQGSWFGGSGININSNFEFKNQVFNFDFSFSNFDSKSNNAQLKLYDAAAEVNFIGKLKPDLTDPYVSGDISGKVNDLTKFAKHFLPDMVITPNLQKEKLQLTGALKVNKNYMQVKDLAFKINNIKDATLNSKVNFYPGAESNIEINISQINLDDIFGLKHKNTTLINELEKAIGGLVRSFNMDIISNAFFAFNLNIHQLIVNSHNISDLRLNFDNFDGNISLNKLQFKLPGKSGFYLNGVVAHNNIRPKFIGDCEFVSNNLPELLSWLEIDQSYKKLYSYNKLIMVSDIELIPYSFQLKNLKSALDDLLFIGGAEIRNQDKNLIYNVRTRFNKINGDDFSLNTKLKDIITNLFVSDHDKTGELFSNFTDNFKWLRLFDKKVNYDIYIDHFLLNDYVYDNFNLSLAISPANLKVNQIAATSKYVNLNGKLNLTLPSFEPNISFKLDCSLFDNKFWDFVIPPRSELESALKAYFHKEEKAKLRSKIEEQGDDTIITGFNFFGLNNNNGNFKISVDDLKYNALEAKDVLLEGSSNSGIITAQSKAKVFDGDAAITTELAILSIVPNVSAALALYNVDPGKLAGAITGLNNMSGYLSASASLGSSGINWPKMIGNLNGKAQVMAKKVDIQGFDLGQLINIPDFNTSYNDKLKRINYYTQYGDTLFDQLQGNISIKNGIATLEDFILENNRVAGGFAASYDIYNNDLSSVSQFSYIPVNTSLQITLGFNSEGHLPQLKTTSNLDKYLTYVKNHTSAMEARSESQKKPSNKQSLLQNMVN